MLEELAAAIDGLDVAPDHDTMVELLRLRDRLNAMTARLVDEFDRSQQWALVGSVTVAQWLRTFGRQSGDEAQRLIKIGRLMRSAPVVAQAARSGEMSGAQARIIANHVPAEAEQLFAEHEAELVPALIPLNPGDTLVAMRAWRQRADAILRDGQPPPAPTPSQAHLARVGERGRLDTDFCEKDLEVVDTAIWAAMSDDADGEPARCHAQKVADALVDICRFFLDHHHSGRISPRRRPHIGVDLSLTELEERSGGRWSDGRPVDPAAIQQMLCDCTINRILWGRESQILDYGRDARIVPPALRRVVVRRDRHCRFSNCDRPAHWCEVHHVTPWEGGGPTNLDNLVLVCSRHHHLLHQPGWHHRLATDATLAITTPQGRTLTSHPPP